MAQREFQLERSATIQAPPSAIYPLLIDLQRWQAWSPWEGLDPNLTRTYSPNTAGVAASYHWKGNRKVGEGRMEILDATEPSKVVIDLEFLKPWKAKNTTTFELAGSPSGATTVRWSMRGPQTMTMRLFGLIFNMDKTVGKDFEKGLAQLRTQAEAAAS